MGRNEATRRSCNYDAPKGSSRTRSILADNETFCLTVWAVAFTLLIVALPTVAAIVRGWVL